MIDLVLFMLIITLTAIFIYVVAPILKRYVDHSDIGSIKLAANTAVLYIEQTSPFENNETKKQMAIRYATSILRYMEIDFQEDILELFIESAVYQMKLSKMNIEHKK